MLRLMETYPTAAVERAVAAALERHSPRLETGAAPPPAAAGRARRRVCPPVTGVRPELAQITVPAPTLSD